MSEYKYDAFISYRHLEKDKIAASKLQQMLENFKPPKSMGKKNFKKWKVFRDETELNSGSDLSSGIKNALEKSRFLIVVCSKETKESKWCMEEINYFKKLHNGSNSNIITLVADGEPSEVFPPALLSEDYEETDENGNLVIKSREIEPLAATITASSNKQMKKKLKKEFLRIAAPIADCGYDDLYNRAQKRKVKRFVTIGALIALLMMSFGVYSSAMLLKINTQKEELLKANEELKLKTEELNKSNKELIAKTKEAENNFKEAEKQKNVAETNLLEANRQKKKAEENLKEANRQKAIAEENLKEATKQKNLAEENLKEANRQKALAEENLNEANRQKTIAKENEEEAVKQKTIAETNEAEATRQKEIAEKNEKEAKLQKNIAEANANEANRQKIIAENNEKEANRQKGIAEENMAAAIANEKKAKDANDNLRRKNAEILASQAGVYYTYGDTEKAVRTAIEALKSGENGEVVANPEAETVLINATGVYSQDDFYGTQNVSLRAPVKQMEISDDCTRILASDTSGNAYLIDTGKSSIIKNWSAVSDFGYEYSGGSIDKLYTEGNIGYILSNYHLICIDLRNGEQKWCNKEIGYSSKMLASNENENIFLYGYGENGYLVNKISGSISHTIDSKFISTDINYPGTDNIYSVDSNNALLKKYNPEDGTYAEMRLSEEKLHSAFKMAVCNDNIYVAYSAESETKLACVDKNRLQLKWECIIDRNIYSALYLDEITFGAAKADGTTEKVTAVVFGTAYRYYVVDSHNGKILMIEKTDLGNNAAAYYTEPKKHTFIVFGEQDVFQVYIYRNYDSNGEEVWSAGEVGVGIPSFAGPVDKVAVNINDVAAFAYSKYNSSEITIKKYMSADKGENISGMEDVKYLREVNVSDDGKVVLSWTKKSGNDEIGFIGVADAESNTLLCEYPGALQYPDITYTDGYILAVENDKYEIYNTKTDKLITGNFKDLIPGLIPENKYINYYGNYIFLNNNKIYYVISDGIFRLDISENGLSAQIVYNPGKDFSIDTDDAEFTDGKLFFELYGGKEYGIAYLDFDDGKLRLIKDGENSLINTTKFKDVAVSGNKVAYIDEINGYIGITETDSGNIRKLNSAEQGIAPELVLLNSDGETLLVVCAGGKIVRYSVDTLEKKGEFTAENAIYDKKKIAFVGPDGFTVEKQFVDLDTMKLKFAFDSGFAGFVTNNKYISKIYNENYNYDIMMYNWLTPEALVEKAEEMFEVK